MDFTAPIGGFQHCSATPLPTLSATAHLFRHETTGAELLWLDRPSENKTFCVSFQTLPEDDTGVFHILEHSVLCGSERYPVKEPFVELMKGSLNTFLNAMTFPDKTVYPISSRDDRDFDHLMRVYLDAVFCPSIYSNPNIFRQEGWHYQLDGDGNPSYVGVVFGEMKGALSSVDEVIQQRLCRMLFPDNCYRFCSGGDPEFIPQLTYEQFLACHRRFYAPSNARFFLDGPVPIGDILAFIGDTYLNDCDPRQPRPALSLQSPIPHRVETAEYELSPEEDPDGKAHFVLGKVAGSWQQVDKLLALEVLVDYLAGSNSAPATRAVLEQGLGEDLVLSLSDGIAQPYLTLQVQHCQASALSGLKAALQNIFRAILDRGLSREGLTASLNRLEFQSREDREPLGVELALRACNAWMYGGDPTLYLDLSEHFARLRSDWDEAAFAALLEEVFLEDQGMAELHVLPSQTLGQRKAQAEQARLASAAGSWSAHQRAQLLAEQQALEGWQQTPDTPEALATIPHLTVSELSPEPLWTDCDQEQLGRVRLLRPRLTTSGTAYFHLYFALPELAPEALSALSLLCRMLGKLPTRRHDGQQLQQAIKTYLGSLEFSLVPLGRQGDPDRARCYLLCSCSVLESNVDRAVSLIREVLLETVLNQPGAVEEILKQNYLSAQQNLIASGHQYAFQHILAGLTAEGKAAEAISGYGFYRYLRAKAEQFDFPSVLAPMEELMGSLSRLPMTLSVTGRVPSGALDALCDGLGGSETGPTVTLSAPISCRDAIVIPSEVAYAVQGGNLYRLGTQERGAHLLGAKILSLNYLWNRVRVQGGAYGAGLSTGANGNLVAFSYRDPNPANTLQVFRGAPDYLRTFCRDREPFDQLLIGAVSDSEPLLAAPIRSRLATERVLRGITLEQKRRERRELLDTSYGDLLDFADWLEELVGQENICIVGGAALLDSCGDAVHNRLL